MNFLMLLLILAFASPAPQTPQSAKPPEEAKELYREGSVKYDAADYRGAIEAFTEALVLVAQAPNTTANQHTRLLLLFNIATAHEQAFKIDQDITHLRQAIELYERYLSFARKAGDLGEEVEVESRLVHLRKQLQIYKQIQTNRANAESGSKPIPPPPSQADQEGAWKRPRQVGVGLLAGGSVLVVGGAITAGVGSQLETRAEQQVAELEDLGVPSEHPAWQEGDDFIAQEKRKGQILLGVGVSLAVVGTVGAGVGSYYLVRSRRLRNQTLSVSPTLSPSFAGVQLTGSF